jgi:O-antigen/teichoic acid export membrane protein
MAVNHDLGWWASLGYITVIAIFTLLPLVARFYLEPMPKRPVSTLKWWVLAFMSAFLMTECLKSLLPGWNYHITAIIGAIWAMVLLDLYYETGGQK